ncbi:MAG TPA: polysaccharide biosynthesis tyrosine autokinase [Opitutaceae bacterium]|nr:polysaccharide biosynthesis tyrosine autokinase [Opitutaceae bacterium]
MNHTSPVYVSSALLEVATPTGDGQNAPPPDLDASDILKTIELKIASQSVLLRMIKDNHLADDPDFAPPKEGGISSGGRGWLAGLIDRGGYPADAKAVKSDSSLSYSDLELVRRLSDRISVSLVRGSRLISVSMENNDPQKAQRLAQALIDEFFQESLTERSKDLASTRELLLAEAKRDSDQLTRSEEKLEAYRDKYNAVSLEEQQNIVVDRLRELNQQVTTAQGTRLAMEPQAEQVRRAADSNPEQLLGLPGIGELPEIVDLRRQIALQEAQVATLSQRYGPLHPTLIQARSQLENLHSSLDSSIRKAGGRILQAYESAQATEAALRQALAKQEDASLELDRIAIPYHTLEREVQANSSMYQKVLAELKQVDVSHSLISLNSADGVDIRVIAPPLVPTRPARPRRNLLLALAVAAGLFLGCGSALFVRAMDNTVSSVDVAESFLGLTVLTTVPLSRHRNLSGHPVVIKYPASAQAESFRSLRTSLSLLPDEDGQKVILFTSAIPGEGKSYCSLNTAAALAQQGFQTLLIDGDLRRPGLQRLLIDWNEKPTLTDCLRRPDLFPQAVQSTSIPNLFCLGDRKHSTHGPELLGGEALYNILQQARARFDRVVVDTAPLLAVSDTLYMAKHVSTICLVVHAGHTSRRLVRRAIKLLDEVAKRRIAGVVLNKASAASQYYYYSGDAKSS